MSRQGDEEFHHDEDWDKMKQGMNKMKQYVKFCREGGRPGCYDQFIDATERGRYAADKCKESLKEFWEHMAEYMEENTQLRGSRKWHDWLTAGNEFRRLIEPLDIAEFFHRQHRNDYMERRNKCYENLEKWENEVSTEPRAGPPNLEGQRTEQPTWDSLFWVRVEKARKLLNSGGPSDDSKRQALLEFENYVMGLIDDSAVSPDVFLEDSTLMQWWLKYEEILDNQMMGPSDVSQFIIFMKNEPHRSYMNRLNR
ncbi:hypothetical protein BT93_C0233 [Corymbia citriodora subsp. variegata]|nr:hypothetical protein BT93_C0233 [Corymbia citriodora subsp. variegata]